MKRLASFILVTAMVMTMFSNITYAAVTDEEEIITEIKKIQETYKPSESYFVSASTQKWVGTDNIDGDKTQGCFAPGTTNSHGRFGGLWQSMGFANYVFYNLFGEMPQFGYHCNPGELNDNVEIIGRYATQCRYIRGTTDGVVNEENIKKLMEKAKNGDIIVATPTTRCNSVGKAMVIIESSEAYAKVYHADFKGECAVTEDIIPYSALADYHCVTLLRSKNYPYPDPVPPSPIEKMVLSNKDFSLNESVNVSWDKTKHTDGYKVELIDENDNIIESSHSKGTLASFVFKKAGIYRIKVVAYNEFGDSTSVYSDNIVVHNQNIVTFKDYDGTVITTQKVEYGKDATAPNVPQRRGYQFAGWDNSLKNITEPTDITATYEIEKYTIRYYDVGGKNILSTEIVGFEGQANLPNNYTIDEGYVFAGWQISFDSIGKDYNCVDGDMSLIATQKWANLNLPITIAISNAQRDSDATYYSADLTVKNHDESNSKNFKIIGTLKSANGKALKSVVLDEVSLDANETVDLDGRRIIFSEKTTTIEFVAVGMVGNSKTGGAYSHVESSNIIDNSQWGSWTDWTTEDKTSSYDDYETKTQYRHRGKVYTTSNNDTLNGWTLYNTTSSIGSWSGWSSTYVSAFTNASQKREVEQRTIPATYKTVHKYSRYVNSTGKWSHWQYGASSCYTYQEIIRDTALPAIWDSSNSRYRYGPDTSYGTYLKNYWWNYWTEQVQTAAAYNQYRYRDTLYTYYYWKWGDWSDWSDTYTSNDGTEERTIYRYRNQNVGGDLEDTNYESFTVEGTINDVESNFSGMTATVMVYKKCNTDPTEEQLEYVGETRIGSNNSYSFEFIPRETPSSETGDFIVALGIEGADRLVNVDVIEANKPSYTVKFIVDGMEYGEFVNGSETVNYQTVIKGENAIAPPPPEKEGFTFVKWSETLTDINRDTVVSAEFVQNEYTIVFIDWEKNSIETQVKKYGDTISYPELDKVEGIKNRVWNKQKDGITNVSESMIVETVVELESYTVTFNDENGVISTQTVEYGNKATVPQEEPTVEGMTFAGWVGSCSPSYITHNVAFTPTYVYDQTVSVPNSLISDAKADGSRNVTLSCDTANAEIYYIIESHNDTDLSLLGEIKEFEDDFRLHATKYTAEITLQENETITFIAYADGMNESIPAYEVNENEDLYFDVDIESNTLREYRSTIEGDISVSMVNNSPDYSMGLFTLCFYDQRGVLIDFIPMNIDIKPGVNVISFEDVCINNIDYVKSKEINCKLLVWLSGEEVVTPISDFVLIDIK